MTDTQLPVKRTDSNTITLDDDSIAIESDIRSNEHTLRIRAKRRTPTHSHLRDLPAVPATGRCKLVEMLARRLRGYLAIGCVVSIMACGDDAPPPGGTDAGTSASGSDASEPREDATLPREDALPTAADHRQTPAWTAA